MIPRVLLVVLAAVAAIVPVPSDVIERWYSRGFYAYVQPVATAVSNLVPVSLLDVAAGVLIVVGVTLVVRQARERGAGAAILRAASGAIVWAAALYLLFLATWGLNYRRVPLEQKLVYEPGRVTSDAALRFAADAIGRVNDGHARAHATTFDVNSLRRAFAEAEAALGQSRLAETGVPKRSLLSIYFRHAAVDGMTDPYFLEVIVNPDVLSFERPVVLAHEWSHLAGYADESEANFVAWLTCIRGDPLAQYSGWLSAYEHAANAVPREARRRLPALDAGPRADLEAEAARYRRSSPVVRTAARNVYDTYLKTNGVREGIASYEAVVRLMLGARFDAQWRPEVHR